MNKDLENIDNQEVVDEVSEIQSTEHDSALSLLNSKKIHPLMKVYLFLKNLKLKLPKRQNLICIGMFLE